MATFKLILLPIYLVLGSIVWSIRAENGCTITLPGDMPESEPVLLLNSPEGSAAYELFRPTGEVTTLSVGAKLLLTCPGNGNAINAISADSLELLCNDGNLFKTADGVEYQLSELGCKSIPTSVLQTTSQTCANDQGYIFAAGFNFNTDDFVSVFTICYDNITENTLYTHNTLNGAAIDYSIQESTRRAFRAEGMHFTTTATNTFYTINNQVERFNNYFGTEQEYVSRSMYMARGHLTPDADFVFGYEQLATYFYANVAPEFQVINAGNWIRVENLARSLAAAYGSDLEIYNGYMGQLELPDPSTSERIAIYLDDDNLIEAPKYYFKVIQNEATDAAIVMITLNNPFATEDDVEEFCTNVCDEANVNSAYFTDRSRGYTFCCTLDEFKNSYGDLPDDLTASHLLTNPTTTEENENQNENENEEAAAVEVVADGCTITMPTDIPNPEPVYTVTTPTDATRRLLWPTGKLTVLPVGSTLTLSCVGSSNKLEALDQASLTLTCQDDKTFYSAEKAEVYTLSQLNCSSIPTSDLLTTSQPCSNGAGYLFEAGFTLDEGFFSTFSICYDNVTENTLYSRSIINGATQNYKISESTRRAFRAEGMQFTSTATNTFYTINNQVERFNNYFGTEQEYVSRSMYMARGHLTPDADFVFGYEQLATYFYANVAPEFQVINAGNWIRVENLARSLATEYGSDLLTYTSTLGLLQLPTDSNGLQAIYLDDGQYIEAPEWYYKILIHPQLPGNLVMITSNNPFADASSIVEFCTNVCELYGVNSDYFTDASRGYTFCCTLADFQSSLSDLPTFDLPTGWTTD